MSKFKDYRQNSRSYPAGFSVTCIREECRFSIFYNCFSLNSMILLS
jgi:hypothetical protein